MLPSVCARGLAAIVMPSLARAVTGIDASVIAPENFALPSTSAEAEMLMNDSQDMMGRTPPLISAAAG